MWPRTREGKQYPRNRFLLVLDPPRCQASRDSDRPSRSRSKRRRHFHSLSLPLPAGWPISDVTVVSAIVIRNYRIQFVRQKGSRGWPKWAGTSESESVREREGERVKTWKKGWRRQKELRSKIEKMTRRTTWKWIEKRACHPGINSPRSTLHGNYSKFDRCHRFLYILGLKNEIWNDISVGPKI